VFKNEKKNMYAIIIKGTQNLRAILSNTASIGLGNNTDLNILPLYDVYPVLSAKPNINFYLWVFVNTTVVPSYKIFLFNN